MSNFLSCHTCRALAVPHTTLRDLDFILRSQKRQTEMKEEQKKEREREGGGGSFIEIVHGAVNYF